MSLPPDATITTYRNPVLPGWNAHPSVCNVPGKGYFVATSSGPFLPSIPVYHSTDLFTWEVSNGSSLFHQCASQRGDGSCRRCRDTVLVRLDVLPLMGSVLARRRVTNRGLGEMRGLLTKQLIGHAIHHFASATAESSSCSASSRSSSRSADSGNSIGSLSMASTSATSVTAGSRAYEDGLWTPSLRYFGGRWYVVVLHEDRGQVR